MLKYKLDSLEGLDEGQQELYKQEGNVYVLQVDGVDTGSEDVSGLKAKVEELLTEKKTSEAKAREAEEAKQRALDEAAAEKARKAGDIEALEQSWQKKFEEQQAVLDQQSKERAEDAIGRAAMGISGKLADGVNQENLEVFVRQRLRYEDGEVKVTDEKGNLTISTVDQLTEEFRANERFASLVTGSKASGSGATTQQGNTGGADKTATRSQFDAMDQNERFSFAKEGGKVIND